jgi:hypothetical protein
MRIRISESNIPCSSIPHTWYVMRVCVCVCVYECMCVYIYVCICMYLYVSVCVYVYVRVYIVCRCVGGGESTNEQTLIPSPYSAMQCNAVQCSAVPYDVTHYDAVECDAIQLFNSIAGVGVGGDSWI